MDSSNLTYDSSNLIDKNNGNNIIYADRLIVSIQRLERNKLLNESDKYMIADYPITSNNLILIKDYRQQLRNYFSSNIIFPFPDFSQLPF